jgi:hypothetical protein
MEDTRLGNRSPEVFAKATVSFLTNAVVFGAGRRSVQAMTSPTFSNTSFLRSCLSKMNVPNGIIDATSA